MTTSNIGRWDRWYAGLTDPAPYGDTLTYELGAHFLASCDPIEDWGCGKGWFAHQRFGAGRVVGVDGSHSPFADVVTDLATYRSNPAGLFMRHVLEHNYQWADILDNAIASFRERMVLVTFTPFADRTTEIAFAEDPGVPDIAFAKTDLTDRFVDCDWTDETYTTATQYGTETIFYLCR